MTSLALPCLNKRRVIVSAIGLLMVSLMMPGVHARPSADSPTVWLAFFSSKTCPKCRAVKRLIRGLRNEYPIKVRVFDIDKQSHYDLMVKLEAIHSEKKFSVPLILIGDTILIGEDTITARLEPTIRRLADSGGSSLPYLGPGRKTRPAAPRVSKHESAADPSRCDCEKRGRPPTIEEEWDRIRRFVGRWL